jgi:hypothetical protein
MGIYDKDTAVKQPTLTAKVGRMIYVDGVSKSVMKRIAKFEFGDEVNSVKASDNGLQFVIILTKEFPDWQIDKFVKFWKTKILIAS